MIKHGLIAVFVAGSFMISDVFGGQRRFAYSYESTTTPKGELEFENWFTWKAHPAADGDARKFEFKHELEFGITDHLQVSFYPATWEIVDTKDTSETRFKSTNAALVYNLTDPTADPLGVGIYAETGIGPELFFLEGKLLLQKNIGPVSLVYNFVLEAGWEGSGYGDEVGEIKNTFGVVYQLTPSWSFGLEGVHEVEWEGWSQRGDDVFYLGPNLSYRKSRFFAVLSPLFQVTDVDTEPDFSTRLIVGIEF